MSEPNTALHMEVNNTEGGLYLSYENANDIEEASKIIAGSARSMGIEVKE